MFCSHPEAEVALGIHTDRRLILANRGADYFEHWLLSVVVTALSVQNRLPIVHCEEQKLACAIASHDGWNRARDVANSQDTCLGSLMITLLLGGRRELYSCTSITNDKVSLCVA